MAEIDSGAYQGKFTGVIIPPPEIKAIADKTAQFVARNGKSFEQRILSSEEGKTSKFNFMREFDPYHAYYEQKIKEFEDAAKRPKEETQVSEEQKSSSEIQPEKVEEKTYQPPVEENKLEPAKSYGEKAFHHSTSARASAINPIAKYSKSLPDEPPENLEFLINHPASSSGVTAQDIDIIKLTAQYTAVRGREFLATLASREQKNPQFDFLKPTHLLFSYFTTLVDSYAKIVHSSDERMAKALIHSNPEYVLRKSVERWNWKKNEEENKKKESDELDTERLAFQAIDWHDFTVVEVIDFPENELLEIPGMEGLNVNEEAPKNLGAAVDESMPPPPPPPPMASHEQEMEVEEDSDIKVVSNYQPRLASKSQNGSTNESSMMMVDPISGKAIPVDKIQEHMRVQLLDPKWREEQQRFIEKQKETGYAEGQSIAESLKLFAKKRGDIFGQSTTGTNSAASKIAQEMEIEEQKNLVASQVQWDGHKSTINMAQQMKQDVSSYQVPSATSNTKEPSKPTIGPNVQTEALLSTSQVPINAPQSYYQMHPPTQTIPSSYPPVPPAAPSPYGYAPIPMQMPNMGMIPPTPPPLGSFPPMAPPPPLAPPGEPNVKRPRVDKEGLVPADEFAAKFPDPISLHISLPTDSSFSSWNLNGQTLEIRCDVTISIKELKELLSKEHLGGMPTSKQQLKSPSMGFLKDANTLASLNIGDGYSLEFSVKSRGGRK